jgi:hypothetical protein
MIHDIQKELDRLDITERPLRNFGLLFCAVFGLWASALLWRGASHWPWLAGGAIVFLVTGLLFPSSLRLPYWLWMMTAFVMGWFVTRIILTTAYFVIMTPMGIIVRLLGKDLLDERIDRGAPTYWKKHEAAEDKQRYRKQF